MVKFQLPRSKHFGLRAFQSFRRPGFFVCLVCSLYCTSTPVCSGSSAGGVLLPGGGCGDYEQQQENPQEEDTDH